MDDRTTVDLYVLNEQADQARSIADPNGFCYENSDSSLTSFTFDEVNYGKLDFLDQLTAAGIAYDSRWSNGCEFTAGVEHLRFTEDGTPVAMEVSDDEHHISLDCLEQAMERPDALEHLRCVVAKLKKETIPLPWDNQVEYGKIYRTKQLITGNTKQLTSNT